MKKQITILDNVVRGLRKIKAENEVVILRCDSDRVWGLTASPYLRVYTELKKWDKDIPEVTTFFHQSKTDEWFEVDCSVREPGGVCPAMQIVFFKWPPGLVCIDYDIASPLTPNPVSKLFHLAEVLWHWITRTKTSQARISRLLDRRFGKEEV